MTPLDPVTTLLRVARGHAWVRETGPNQGQAVNAILAKVGLPPGQPWCAAFVAYVGNLIFGPAWPLPLVGGCVSLAEAAEARGFLVPAAAPGEIFLLWSPTLGRFRHTGFVSAGGLTVEGNASLAGSPEGTGVFLRQRSFGSKDKFIKWF